MFLEPSGFGGGLKNIVRIVKKLKKQILGDPNLDTLEFYHAEIHGWMKNYFQNQHSVIEI